MIFSDPDKITTSITDDRPPYRLLVPWFFINLINVNVRNIANANIWKANSSF